MKYNKVLEKAFPTIYLHDCEIKNLTYEDGCFNIYFSEGFFLNEGSRTEGDAKIIIKTSCVDDALFMISKSYRFIKSTLPFYITKYKKLKDLKKLLEKGYYFTILNEYYIGDNVLWRGVIERAKNGKIENAGYFEFNFDSESLLYYFNTPFNVSKNKWWPINKIDLIKML